MTEKRFKEIISTQKVIDNHTGKEYDCLLDNDLFELINTIAEKNEQLEKELERCKDWINSDKNDYELTLSFIKNKGYSLKDVLEYEKELKE